MLNLRNLAALAAAVAVSACGTAPPAPASGSVLAPNVNLFVQGIPPIPQELVKRVEKYTDFRGHGFVDWHPSKREMLVAYRKAGANTAQLFRLDKPMGELEQLTDFADPVSRASYEPRIGNYLVFERSTGGNEAAQIYRLDMNGRQVTLLSDTTTRNSIEGWMHNSSRLLISSLPLDRTAEGGTRSKVTQVISIIDPMDPASRTKLVELDGTGWDVGGVSWDDKKIALTRFISVNEAQVWLFDIASRQLTQIIPAAGSSERAFHTALGFKRDNSGIFVLSDYAGEFRQGHFYNLGTRRFTPITGHINWDMDGGAISEDGSLIAARINADGRRDLRFFEGDTFRELPQAQLPSGNIGATSFHRTLRELAFGITSAKGPGQIFAMDPRTRQVVQWTRAYAPDGIDMSAFADQQIIRWKSFDGRMISGLLTLPPSKFKGPRPVMVAIHGGPEGQATMGFLGRQNYLLNELGIAVIEPNVRGSTGYGKTFLALDNGFKREDSVKDIGALFDWISTQPMLDAKRVMVSGGSYGGYMSLAVSTTYPDRIAGAIDVVGISNFVTFLQTTESYRRDLRRVEYGDERDPAMREFLIKISPLTNANKIRKPLFVVQGKNDPRVPYTEAEQIVAAARKNGTPVWYLRAENEGHGFARKENADFYFYSSLMFIENALLK